MDPTTAIGSLFAAFGLSGAAGLNAWVPLLATAAAARLGWLELAQPYDVIATTPGLIGLAGALALDFVGDKVPGVDHALHAAGAVVHPAAGAILFAAQTGIAGDLDPTVALVLGALVSGGVHAERAALRPVSTAGTGGLANPLLSLLEDGGSLVLTAVAFLAPILAVAGVAALLVLGLVAVRTLRRRRRAMPAHSSQR